MGPDQPKTLLCMTNLATVLGYQGRYDESERLFRETIEIYLQVLGRDHPRTLLCMYTLGWMYGRQGRHEEAEALYRETLEIRRRVLGQDHPDTLRSLNDLVVSYEATGKTEEARLLVAELLSLRRAAAEASEADARTKNTYAWAILTCEPADLQDPEDALEFAREANELTRFENPSYLDTLALAYHRTGQTATAIETQRKAISLLPDRKRDRYKLSPPEISGTAPRSSNLYLSLFLITTRGSQQLTPTL